MVAKPQQAAWGEALELGPASLCTPHLQRGEFSLKAQLRASPLLVINLCHIALPLTSQKPKNTNLAETIAMKETSTRMPHLPRVGQASGSAAAACALQPHLTKCHPTEMT